MFIALFKYLEALLVKCLYQAFYDALSITIGFYWHQSSTVGLFLILLFLLKAQCRGEVTLGRNA